MTDATYSEVPLLPRPSQDGSSDTFEKSTTNYVRRRRTLDLQHRGFVITLLFFTLVSFTINVIFVFREFSKTSLPSSCSGRSAYTGLSLDTPSTHFHHTDYWGSNQTLADQLWENIDTNPMVVALTDAFADAHDLPRSDRFPWDKSKGRYFIKVFHQLHCLVSIVCFGLNNFFAKLDVEVYTKSLYRLSTRSPSTAQWAARASLP